MIKAAIYGRVGKDGDWMKAQSGIEMACTTLAVNDATNTEGEVVWFCRGRSKFCVRVI